MTLIPGLQASSPPDVEALRIFLTLPYVHFFNDPEYYINIICPFTRAVLHTLDKNASKVLGQLTLRFSENASAMFDTL